MNDRSAPFHEYQRSPDRSALARLLRAYQDEVFNLCYQVLRHSQDAEDAAQQSLLKVAKQIQTVGQQEAFASWLYRVTFHTALDFKRKRGRQRRLESIGPQGSAAGEDTSLTDLREAVYQGMRRLDDDHRGVLIEYYFNQRTLEEMAGTQGCTPATTWKKIERAKDRLKNALALSVSGTPTPAPEAVLGSLRRVGAPRDLIGGKILSAVSKGGGATVVAGGSVMTGKLVLFGVPMILLGLVGAGGLILAARSQGADPGEIRPNTSSVGRQIAPVGTGSSAAAPTPSLPVAGKAPEAERVSRRRAYPYLVPSPAWPPAVTAAWRKLKTRMDLVFEDSKLEDILTFLHDFLETKFMVDPGVAGRAGLEKKITIKVKNLEVDKTLRLLGSQFGLEFEVLDDGTVFLTNPDRLPSTSYRGSRGIGRVLEDLQRVQQEMGKGWDGVVFDRGGLEKSLGKKLLPAQGETTLEKAIARLRDTGKIRIYLDPVHLEGAEDLMKSRVLNLYQERSIREHLDWICRDLRLDYYVAYGHVIITTPEKSAAERRQQAARQTEHRAFLDRLERPIPTSSSMSMPDYADALKASLGSDVFLSREVWESDRQIDVPPASSLRNSLDRLSTSTGFRWAVREGKLYIVK